MTVIELHYSYSNFEAFLIAAVPAIITLALAVYVFMKLPRNLQTGLFVVDLVFTTCWQLGSAMMRISADEATANFWDSIFAPFGLLCSPLILHFSLLFTQKQKIARYTGMVFLFYFITFMLALMYPVYSTQAGYHHIEFWGWINIRSDSVYHGILGGFLQIQYFITIGLLTNTLRKAKRKSNRYYQLLLLDAGLIFIIVQAFVTEAIIPLAFKHDPIPVTSSLIVLYIIAAFIALTKFRLFGGIEAIDKGDLLASISDIVIVINPELKITYINDAGLKHIGGTFENIEGMPVTTILTIVDDKAADFEERVVEPVLNGIKVSNVECNLSSTRQDIIQVLVSSDMLKSAEQNDGILLVCRNISDLVKINKELDKFIYSASHDIRSPLMTVLGLLNIADDEVKDETAKMYFGLIRESMLKLDVFTLNIIRFSKNIRTDVIPEKFALSTLVNEIVENCRQLDNATGIRFETDVDEHLVFSTDIQRLFIALSLLVSNAVKYQRPENKNKFVKIAGRIHDDSLYIEMEDNGEGIPEQYASRIFDMFSKFSDQSHGAGLGLYIVHEVVQKLKGYISVTSTVNRGSKFVMVLPYLE